jgi:hypothetical protein
LAYAPTEMNIPRILALGTAIGIYAKGCRVQRVYANQKSTNQIQDATYIAVFNFLILAPGQKRAAYQEH